MSRLEELNEELNEWIFERGAAFVGFMANARTFDDAMTRLDTFAKTDEGQQLTALLLGLLQEKKKKPEYEYWSETLQPNEVGSLKAPDRGWRVFNTHMDPGGCLVIIWCRKVYR